MDDVSEGRGNRNRANRGIYLRKYVSIHTDLCTIDEGTIRGRSRRIYEMKIYIGEWFVDSRLNLPLHRTLRNIHIARSYFLRVVRSRPSAHPSIHG